MYSFPSETQVWGNPRWASFLRGQGGNPAGKIESWQLRGRLEMESNIEILRRVVFSRNPTTVGQMLYNSLKKTNKKIHFIGWRMGGRGQDGVALPGFSSFENDCPTIGEATIYVNLDLCLQVQKVGKTDLSKILNGYIILLHEMGHAHHWLTWGSAKFDGAIGKNPKHSQILSDATKPIRDKIMSMPGKYCDKKALIEEAVLKKVGHATYYGNGFPNDIELMNWVEHEGPICDAWKIARRKAYTDIQDVW